MKIKKKLNITLRDAAGRIQIRHSGLSTRSDIELDTAYSKCGNFTITTLVRAQPHRNPPRK